MSGATIPSHVPRRPRARCRPLQPRGAAATIHTRPGNRCSRTRPTSSSRRITAATGYSIAPSCSTRSGLITSGSRRVAPSPCRRHRRTSRSGADQTDPPEHRLLPHAHRDGTGTEISAEFRCRGASIGHPADRGIQGPRRMRVHGRLRHAPPNDHLPAHGRFAARGSSLADRAGSLMTRSNDTAKRAAAYQEILDYLEKWVNERREHPGKDLISRDRCDQGGRSRHQPIRSLGRMRASPVRRSRHRRRHDGLLRPLPRRKPSAPPATHRRPDIDPGGSGELLRRYSIPFVSRRVTRDLELGGVQMKAGDLVIFETCLHGLDQKPGPTRCGSISTAAPLNTWHSARASTNARVPTWRGRKYASSGRVAQAHPALHDQARRRAGHGHRRRDGRGSSAVGLGEVSHAPIR